jgi:hypothetical protein
MKGAHLLWRGAAALAAAGAWWMLGLEVLTRPEAVLPFWTGAPTWVPEATGWVLLGLALIGAATASMPLSLVAAVLIAGLSPLEPAFLGLFGPADQSAAPASGLAGSLGEIRAIALGDTVLGVTLLLFSVLAARAAGLAARADASAAQNLDAPARTSLLWSLARSAALPAGLLLATMTACLAIWLGSVFSRTLSVHPPGPSALILIAGGLLGLGLWLLRGLVNVTAGLVFSHTSRQAALLAGIWRGFWGKERSNMDRIHATLARGLQATYTQRRAVTVRAAVRGAVGVALLVFQRRESGPWLEFLLRAETWAVRLDWQLRGLIAELEPRIRAVMSSVDHIITSLGGGG